MMVHSPSTLLVGARSSLSSIFLIRRSLSLSPSLSLSGGGGGGGGGEHAP